ncbi:MAG TPA: xanthine dehydrogenase family protein subunit M [Acidobacteriaceae bacterium]|jgi:xanthine dehydrogenase YagS FAD-binding subunit|nr:xanthine dehydrogenase family protein subunit M [Acidobacteriaceae bacterium]
MNSFVFAECTTVDAALSQLEGKAVVKAGGIDLLDRMKNGIEAPPKLVNIHHISSLRGVHETKEGVTLGPLVTLTEISEHPLLQSQYTVFADAAGHAATPHIRNVATLGGNLLQRVQCWYYRSPDYKCLRKGGDMCYSLNGMNQYHAIFDNSVSATVVPSSTAVALTALNASVELTSAKGKRTVALRDLYVKPEVDPVAQTAIQPDELLTAVMIPKPAAGTRSAYQKYGEKESFDWAIADAAVVLEMQGDLCKRATIVLGAASPTPRHATEAEAMLSGKRITEENARAAGTAAMKDATPLAMNGYKVQLFPVAIYRTVLLAAGKMGRDPSAAG